MQTPHLASDMIPKQSLKKIRGELKSTVFSHMFSESAQTREALMTTILAKSRMNYALACLRASLLVVARRTKPDECLVTLL